MLKKKYKIVLGHFSVKFSVKSLNDRNFLFFVCAHTPSLYICFKL